MRRNVAGTASTQTTSSLLFVHIHTSTAGRLLDRGHGVFERTAGCEVLATANTALDLLVLELVLDAALLAAGLLHLLGLRLPVHAGTEHEVFADRCGVERGTRGVALLQTEFGPRAPLSHLGVDMFPDDSRLDAAGDLHFLVVVVEAVRNHRLRAVFVRNHLLRGESGRVVELLVVGPVGAAEKLKICLAQSFKYLWVF